MIIPLTKRITTAVLFAGLFVVLPSVLSFFTQQTIVLYSQYAPIESFLETNSLDAEDVCYGDTQQVLNSGRVVKQTPVGYPAVVLRELSLVDEDTLFEVFKERKDIFIQTSTNGANTRLQKLPPLEIGEYQWYLYISIDINGVIRTDVPPWVSNVFKVKQCDL